MKRLTILLSILACSASAFAATPAKQSENNVYVKVKETKLRSAPEYLAPGVTSLRFGDSLNVVSADQGSWLQVSTAGGKKGFIHMASVSNRKIVVSGKDTSSLASAFGASNDEVVLAGKGFSAEVERGYASKNPTLNFSAVNSMERLKISEAEVRAFIQAGGLNNG